MKNKLTSVVRKKFEIFYNISYYQEALLKPPAAVQSFLERLIKTISYTKENGYTIECAYNTKVSEKGGKAKESEYLTKLP